MKSRAAMPTSAWALATLMAQLVFMLHTASAGYVGTDSAAYCMDEIGKADSSYKSDVSIPAGGNYKLTWDTCGYLIMVATVTVSTPTWLT